MKLFAPSAPKPKVNPMADEEAIRKAKLRAAEKMRTSSGRDSTILGGVNPTDKLGG